MNLVAFHDLSFYGIIHYHLVPIICKKNINFVDFVTKFISVLGFTLFTLFFTNAISFPCNLTSFSGSNVGIRQKRQDFVSSQFFHITLAHYNFMK